jgi:transposase
LAALLNAHERAFHHFGNLTEELLSDHPRTVALKRDRQGQHIQ